MNPDFSVVIVSYNTAALLKQCIASVLASESVSAEIIVVDNASKDASPDMMTETFPQVRLIANNENLGFSKANNQALNICAGKRIFFLNPDTTVAPDTLKNAAAYMDNHPETGLAGTRLMNPDGTPQESIEHRYPGHRHARKELTGLRGDVAWVMGAAMIAPAGVIADTAGFDEDFFLYGEDMDLCLRIRKAGFAIGYAADAVVTHWGGASESATPNYRLWEKKFNAELLFYEKHYAPTTVRAIRRSNVLKALWRIIVLWPGVFFSRPHSPAAIKLARYRMALSIYARKKAVIGSSRPI